MDFQNRAQMPQLMFVVDGADSGWQSPLNAVKHQFFHFMATTAQSQHRCVFVGNIPYDATEEHIIQICEEVGPVVSFRLVIDRETGKPKGYGFCEYKDEETALSARRNLQGYEINGRQLRVDFAENDKNTDRSREQGRGGSATVTNTDSQKPFVGQAVPGDPDIYQPIGDSVAMSAATVMAGALGGVQTPTTLNQIGLQTQSFAGIDPLTSHLAKMSRSQLTQIMSELKAMAAQNKDQASQLLMAIPNLPKALFQAQLMLGIVSPQMLQMANVKQASAKTMQPLVQSGQSLPGLPPLPQNKLHIGSSLSSHGSQVSTSLPIQYDALAQVAAQSQVQPSQLTQNQVLRQGQLLVQSGVSPLPSVSPQSLGTSSVRPHIHVPITSSLNQNALPPVLHASQNPTTTSVYSSQLITKNVSTHPSSMIRPQSSADGLQSRFSLSATPENKDREGLALSALVGSSKVSNSMDQVNGAPASKLVKLNDGRGIIPPSQDVNMVTPASGPSQTFNPSGRKTSQAEESLNSGKQPTQMQVPVDVDSGLLEQVLKLTPEQLGLLPPDQQLQVIQLQKMLRQAS